MRLDKYLTEVLKIKSRNKAVEMIELKLVKIDGKIAIKASTEVKDNTVVEVMQYLSYETMGGYKLAKAIIDFGIEIKGKICLDIGASNGGFTDCLLQNDAESIIALDVGENMLPDNLTNHNRVVVMDKTNARYLTKDMLGKKMDIVVSDVSFISLRLILPSIADVLDNNGMAVLLYKPQFEVGKEFLSKKGIVKEDKIIYKKFLELITFAEQFGFVFIDITIAPEREGKNKEYMFLLKKEGNKKVLSYDNFKSLANRKSN